MCVISAAASTVASVEGPASLPIVRSVLIGFANIPVFAVTAVATPPLPPFLESIFFIDTIQLTVNLPNVSAGAALLATTTSSSDTRV